AACHVSAIILLLFSLHSLPLTSKLFPYTTLFRSDFAEHLKTKEKHGIPQRFMSGKQIALIFEKQSTRTRSAFTVAAGKLGATVDYLNKNDLQLGAKESVEDTAKVLGSMFDGSAFRGFEQKTVEALGDQSGVPAWSATNNDWHPTQMLADLLTIK